MRILVTTLAALGMLWPVSSLAATTGVERLAAFTGLHPFLQGEDETAQHAMSRECLTLRRRCLRYLREHPAEARRSTPDNPAYWQAYRTLLDADFIARSVEEVEAANHRGLISAANHWLRYQLLANDRLDPARLHFHVRAHRRLLAESRFLIEKMIFTATTGITLNGINVLMAQLGSEAAAAQEQLVDEMLAPLSVAELSLRAVMQGERAYAQATLKEQPELARIDPLSWSQLGRFHDLLGERSEAGWRDYWQRGVDLMPVLAGFSLDDHVPHYHDYSTNVRYLDATLHVLRALREFYRGRATPGVPATPPPALWYWQWREQDQELCLEPGAVHPSLGMPQTICTQYLGRHLGPAPRSVTRTQAELSP